MAKLDINDTLFMEEWLTNLMNCRGGFAEWEKTFEYTGSREIAFAAFVLRCLGNPDLDMSDEILKLILDKRQFFSDYDSSSFGL